MDPALKRILDERLARGQIDSQEYDRLARKIEGSNVKLYGVLLNAPSSSKIETIKAVREATGCGLKEAKLLVESAPVLIAEGIDRDAAGAIVQNLLDIGARADLAAYDSPALIPGRQVAAQARAQAASGCLMALALLLALVLLAGMLPAETAAFTR
jgi:ribosomal protein L7/L12